MAIVRVVKNKNFSIVSNQSANDKRLSIKAKGIMFYLLTKPDDWTIRVTDIANNTSSGLDMVKGTLKELVKFGYAKLTKGDINGKFGSFYTVYEEIPKETKS